MLLRVLKVMRPFNVMCDTSVMSVLNVLRVISVSSASRALSVVSASYL